MTSPIEDELADLVDLVTERITMAYLEAHGGRVNLTELARNAVITGLDMGLAFATAFPGPARRVQDVVRVGAGLTEADEAQRLLTFEKLVAAAGGTY